MGCCESTKCYKDGEKKKLSELNDDNQSKGNSFFNF